MRTLSIQIIVILVLLVAMGTTTAWAGDKEKGADILSGTGTINYINLEGGFYGLVADDGQKYLPKDLAQDLKVNGLRVSLYMWGTPVEVLSIEKL
jgi:uncharacterized protein YidB (DUF937 family)